MVGRAAVSWLFNGDPTSLTDYGLEHYIEEMENFTGRLRKSVPELVLMLKGNDQDVSS